ncbi:hypothetical protein [Sorangium sp. So ce128]|uniref:hypothetical protein n=1 Tax=Sorangium sp. So ce128 TaxID=3133281 RepID=UPI003F63D3F2
MCASSFACSRAGTPGRSASNSAFMTRRMLSRRFLFGSTSPVPVPVVSPVRVKASKIGSAHGSG